MYKPLPLLIGSLFALVSYSQKTDTLVLLYKPDKFSISLQYQQKLDSFLLHGWDRISINGYTDETDDEDHNIDLSRKRSAEVYRYFINRNLDSNRLTEKYFGESIPIADNNTEEGRALNRRTVIIGYQFARVGVVIKPKEDLMIPVTRTLDNGMIITYRPGALPYDMADNFAAGSGMNFQLINNTIQMRQNNMFNNTTRGEILSSVMIICGNQLNPCKLDSPILVRVPIPYRTKCPIEKVKFFNTVIENEKQIWQEQTKLFYPEEIGDKKYIRIWMDDFCRCINFDFKIDPECFETDSTQLLFVNAEIKNLSAELKGLNSVYLPRKINDTTHSLLYLKNELKDAMISFGFYKGKKRIRSFRDQPVSSFPFDEINKQYLLSSGTIKLYFPGLNVYFAILKVNADKYWTYPEKNRSELKYLNRKTEKILVDFMVVGRRGKVTMYNNQPIESIPFDASSGYYIIDKDFIKLLKEKGSVAGK